MPKYNQIPSNLIQVLSYTLSWCTRSGIVPDKSECSRLLFNKRRKSVSSCFKHGPVAGTTDTSWLCRTQIVSDSTFHSVQYEDFGDKVTQRTSDEISNYYHLQLQWSWTGVCIMLQSSSVCSSLLVILPNTNKFLHWSSPCHGTRNENDWHWM